MFCTRIVLLQKVSGEHFHASLSQVDTHIPCFATRNEYDLCVSIYMPIMDEVGA